MIRFLAEMEEPTMRVNLTAFEEELRKRGLT